MDIQGFLKQGLDEIGIDYTDSDVALLETYIHEITLWNKSCGLVKAEGKDLIIRHIFDSLAPLPLLEQMEFATAADAGSGAGLPGIPLAVFLKDKKMTLIERSAKRSGFLLNAVSVLNLRGRVSLNEAPVEKVTEHFDVVVFRAFRQFEEFYKPLMNLLRPGGVLFAYKGKKETILREIKMLSGDTDAEIIKITVPFLENERHILKLRKSHQ